MNDITLKLFNDKEFLKKVLPMKPEEAQKEFEANGSDITVEDLRELGNLINKATNNELGEDDLENIAGGCWQDIKDMAKGIAIGIAIVGICTGW